MLAPTHIGKDGVKRAASTHEGLVWAHSPIGNLICGTVIPICALVIITLVCFYRTLSGYFAADDFIHIAYLAKVFNGHPELLLQNFTGNWMQAEGTQFYRPLITLTLAWDYLLGGSSALFFHASNAIFQIASTVFLFLLARLLANEVGAKNENAFGFGAAALFAVWPLHCEVVSWVIGRVDSVCTAFSLAAFWLFLKCSRDRSFPVFYTGLAAFVLALMSKEMAVTIPAAVALFFWIRPLGENERINWRQRAFSALRASLPLWIILFVYFGIRCAALGTLTGGYSGSVGDSLTNSFWHRFFGDGSIQRIFLPFNEEVFSPREPLRKVLVLFYVATGLLALLRLTWFKYQSGLSRLIPFAAIWFVLSLAPTYQVFNIAPSLQCSRFAYMSTAPLCLLLAALIIPLQESMRKFSRAAMVCGYALLTAFLICGVTITQKNNLPWAHAFDQVKAFRKAVVDAAEKLPPAGKMAILNVPERMQGAHMIYNGAMLSVLLSPPLSPHSVTEKVISFEPAMWGEPDMINISRVRALLAANANNEAERLAPTTGQLPGSAGVWPASHCLIPCRQRQARRLRSRAMNRRTASLESISAVVPRSTTALAVLPPNNCAFYRWDWQHMKLVPVNFGPDATQKVHLHWTNVTESFDSATVQNRDAKKPVENQRTIMSPDLSVSAASIDFIDIAFSADSAQTAKTSKHDAGNQFVILSWRSPEQATFPTDQKLALPVTCDGQIHHYRFYVSEHKSWLMTGTINRIAFDFPCLADNNSNTLKISEIGIDSGEHEIPQLTASTETWNQNNDGTLYPSTKRTERPGTGANLVDSTPQANSASATISTSESGATAAINSASGNLLINIDASQIHNASSIRLELSPVNTWFEHYSGHVHDLAFSNHAQKVIQVPSTAGQVIMTINDFPQSGFYELRAFAVTADGQPVGCASDPLNLQVDVNHNSASGK